MDRMLEEFSLGTRRRPGRPSKNEPVELKPLESILNPLGPEFTNLVKRAFVVLAERDAHYSGSEPFGNFKSANKIGIPEWLSVINRMEDKISRMEQQSKLVMRGLDAGDLFDTLIDLGNYAYIAAYFFDKTNLSKET